MKKSSGQHWLRFYERLLALWNRKMRIAVLLNLVLGLALAGCSTPYQSEGLRGGFTETQLQPNVYRVSFSGNAATSPQEASDYAFLRAGELTLENGYTHFVVTDAENYTQHGTYTAPGSSTSTVSAQTYGSQTYGTVTTRQTPGQTYQYFKPRSNMIVIMGGEELANGQAQPFDARFLVNSLKSKYDIE